MSEKTQAVVPATPLPWFYGIAYEYDGDPVPFDYRSPGFYDNPAIIGGKTMIVGCDDYNVFDNPQDTAYIVHACNALPEITAKAQCLADALAEAVAWLNDPRLSQWPYMEGPQFYADKTKLAGDLEDALADWNKP